MLEMFKVVVSVFSMSFVFTRAIVEESIANRLIAFVLAQDYIPCFIKGITEKITSCFFCCSFWSSLAISIFLTFIYSEIDFILVFPISCISCIISLVLNAFLNEL